MRKKRTKKCRMCENQVPLRRTYCSRLCMGKDSDKILKMKQTNLKRYGVEQPTQNEEINRKRKQTNTKKYGAEDPRSNENIKQKIEQTNLEKYGVRRPIQNKIIRQKQQNTTIERYGQVFDLSNPEMRKKWEQTNLKKYGVKNPSSSEEIQQKIEQTNLEKYGVRRPIQNEEIKKKIEQTNLERYGVKNATENEKVKQQRQETNIKKYNTPYHVRKHNLLSFELLADYEWLYDQYIIQQKSARGIANELQINIQTVCNYLHAYGILIRRIANFSYIATQWLEYISQTENIFIQHAGNIGEYLIPETRYSADGYCKETNTVYEFHGDYWHGNPEKFSPDEYCHPFNPDITAGELYEKTKKREQRIKQLGYNLIIMWESQWTNITR